MNELIIAGIFFFVIATTYSTVGHAGASGYLAAMALLAFPPDIMKPSALAMNILVALIASWRFYKAGYFSWKLFWPFAAASVPLAYLGGGLAVPAHIYKPLIALALLIAAAHLLIRRRARDGHDGASRRPGITVSLAAGGLIGFLSGLTGIGGGIFLSPLLVISRWASLRQASATAAVFILVNSISGLAGHLMKGGTLPGGFPVWAVFVIAGGFLGSSLGATKLNNPVLRVMLGILLVFAGIMIAT